MQKSKLRYSYVCSIFLMTFLNFVHNQISANELTKIDYYQENDTSYLELTFADSIIKANKFHVSSDKQIILDIKEITANERVLRTFDTSEFSGAVVLVSPYKKVGADKDIRIAIQLRDNVRSFIKQKDNKLVLAIENRFGVFTKEKIDKFEHGENAIAFGKGAEKINIPKSENIIDILENLTLSGEKKYIGKKISINVKEIQIENLLKMLADASGFNIIISDEVKNVPRLTIALTNIPWDQALDTILSLGKLVAKKNGNILMITTLEKASEEERLASSAKAVTIQNEPLLTRIFPISFADITSLSTLLLEYITKGRGSIAQDARTNSLIVKDTIETIEKIKKIIETLDTQTPQILIEAKIVEATETFSKQIGLQNGLVFGYDPVTPSGTLIDSGPGFQFSSTSPLDKGLAGFNIKGFNRLLNLDLTLSLMESESKGKVISSPKIITENKKPAIIKNEESTSFPIVTISNGATTTTFQRLSVTLSLEVTPQVTNEGSIALKVNLVKGGFGSKPNAAAPPDQAVRSLNTNVLVDNGSTIVIGGIYNFTKTRSERGVPFLKDLPILGWLFRTPYNPDSKKSELIIFLTPRIINQEEAGLVNRDDSLG